MLSPYGLDVVESCFACKARGAGTWCDLSRTGLEAVNEIQHPTAYPRGAVLFVEGQAPRGIFMLCRGRVKLSIRASASKRLILNIAEPGEVFGLSATIAGSPYELTAETMEPSQVNFVHREKFLGLIKDNSEACFKVAEQLSETCSALCNKVRLLGVTHTAEQRVAKVLLELSRRRGKSVASGAPLSEVLTHGEIAEMIGTTRETVNRIVTRLKNRHILEADGASMVIRNEAALEVLATNGDASTPKSLAI